MNHATPPFSSRLPSGPLQSPEQSRRSYSHWQKRWRWKGSEKAARNVTPVRQGRERGAWEREAFSDADLVLVIINDLYRPEQSRRRDELLVFASARSRGGAGPDAAALFGLVSWWISTLYMPLSRIRCLICPAKVYAVSGEEREQSGRGRWCFGRWADGRRGYDR